MAPDHTEDNTIAGICIHRDTRGEEKEKIKQPSDDSGKSEH